MRVPADAALQKQVAGLEWYHTLDLAPGITTPGWFDTRSLLKELPFPASLAGRRCLDIGTFDGFWAFEMEKREASEVVAIDILDPRRWDWPAGSEAEVVAAIGARKGRGEGFAVAHRALGSRVERQEKSVYELDPTRDGTFDFVYLGSLLLHLRDPVGALQRVRSVCTDELLLVDAIDIALTLRTRRRPMASLDGVGRPWWWKPNLAALVRMVEAAGFRVIQRRRCMMPPGPGQGRSKVSLRTLASRPGREIHLRERLGDPHGVVSARAV